MVNKLKVWLSVSSKKTFTWSKIRYAFATILLITIALWSPLIAPQLTKKDFNAELALTQTEDLYDTKTGGFSGPLSFASTMKYQEVSVNNGSAELTNTFLSKNGAGQQIWLSAYSYKANRASNAHDSTYSTKSRTGYVFGKVSGGRESYTFWHPKYDIPLTMNYIEDEAVHGLNTYKFRAGFSENVTKDYREFGGYTSDKDIVSKGAVNLWIEPQTGNLIKYSDSEELYYFNSATGAEISPWKTITDEFNPEVVNDLAIKTEAYKNNSTIVISLIPAVLTLSFVAIFAFIVGDIFKRHRDLRIDSVSAGLITAVISLSLIVLYGWQTVNFGLTSTNYRVAITSLGSAVLLVVLACAACAVVYLENAKKIYKLLLSLVPTVVIALAVAVLFGANVLSVSRPSAWFFIALGIALLLSLLNSKKRVFIILFNILVWAVACIGILFEASLPLRFESPWIETPATPTSLMFALLAIAIYRTCYANAKTNKTILSMPMRVTVAIVGMAVILTGFLWRITQDSISVSGARKFEDDTNHIAEEIDESINKQALALIGGVGLFDASETVTRQEWSSYFRSLHPVQNIPGVTCVGYGIVLPKSAKTAFEQSLSAEGLKNVSIYPQTDLDQMVVVDFVEPYEECEAAIGFDMNSSPERRAAMDLARDSGMPVMSSKVRLIIETEPNAQSGFQMYVPVYKKDASFDTLEHRRNSLQGYVLGPVRMDNFMEATLGNSVPDIGIEVYDADNKNGATADNKMYASNPDVNLDDSRFNRSVILDTKSHDWLIKFGSLPQYTPGNAFDYSIYVLAGGLLISAMIGVATYSLYGSRERALKLAKVMSSNLRIERNNAIDLQREDDAIFSNMGEGLILIDTKYKVHRANSFILNLLGYSGAEFVGQDAAKATLFINEDRTTVDLKAMALKCELTGRSCEFSQLLVRKDGSTVPVRLSVSPVRIDGHRPTGTVIIVSDITKQYELDKAKDLFLSLATHQLKTPITAIKWYAEMMLGVDKTKEVLPPTKRRIALSIVKAVKHMMYIVDNLLNVSRIETGRLKADLKPVSVPAVVRQVIADQKPVLHSKKQKIMCECDEDIAKISADKQLLGQIFANLISNASKYSPNESEIEVVIKQTLSDIAVSVKDHGMGIPKHQQSEVFKKFFRADNAIKREASGNGLGLYLVKALVKVNHGSIKFVSQENKGTTFTVSFPKMKEK